jgi:hypothetical protein
MGKSWKEKPDKWRKNRDFQKKQQKKHGKNFNPSHPPKDEYSVNNDFGIAGCDDFDVEMT